MKKEEKKQAKVAVIRVRGDVGLSPKVRTTLKLLKLYKKNYCVIVSNDPDSMGMLARVKDYTTFGEIDSKTFQKLLEKRGRLAGNKSLTDEYMKKNIKSSIKDFVSNFMNFKINIKDVPGCKTFFRLHPPEGGFERKGIKFPYALGGALGYRGTDINKLILRML